MIMHSHLPMTFLFILIIYLFNPRLVYSEVLSLQSLSLRASLSEKTVLGNDAQENFEKADVAASFDLPWKKDLTSGWGTGTRLMTSIGILRGVGENALVVSFIPEFTLGSDDGRYTLDIGAGGALFSRYRFGKQDYGGPFQFALTAGVNVPLYKKLGLGYRFLHYSDADIHGSGTTGADLHMLELSLRF